MNHVSLSVVFLATTAFAQNAVVVPPSAATQLGGSQGGFPFSYTDYVRYQQAIGTNNFPGAAVLHGMSLRTLTPGSIQTVPDPATQGIRVTLSDSRNPPNALNTSYAANAGTNATVVFDGSINIQKINAFDPLEWNLTIPFSRVYVHTNAAPLLVDLFPTSYEGQTCNGGGNGTSFDAVMDPTFGSLLGKGPCGTGPTVGSFAPNSGFVIRFYTDAGVQPYGKACPGTNRQAAAIGSSGGGATLGNAGFTLTLAGAAPSANAAAFLLGGSNTTWGGSQLPFELLNYGMPDCFLHQDLALVLPRPIAGGNATMPFGIPNNAWLSGKSLFAQWAVLDPGANGTGAILSQGGWVLMR